AREEIVDASAGRDRAIAPAHEIQTIGAAIAHGGQFGRGQVVDDARVVRPPVAEADEPDPNPLPGLGAVRLHRIFNTNLTGTASQPTVAAATASRQRPRPNS